MDIHFIIDIFTSLVVLCGSLFMLAAILVGQKMKSYIPEALLGQWRPITMLMQFFFVGYLLLIIILVSRINFQTELVVGPVFFGGAVFVFIVTKLTKKTIRQISQAEENLQLLNESLELRIVERTRNLEQSQKFLKAVLDNLNDEVLIIDVDTHIIVGANAAFLASCKMREDAVLGKKCHEVTHHRPEPCTPPHDICPLLETIETGKHAIAEHIHFNALGNKQYIEVSSSPIQDTDGRIIRIIHISKDITERKLAEQRIEHLALYDSLTGLPNRMLFFDRLNQALALAKRNQHICALLYMDLDAFKAVNDNLGHEAGDQLLQEVSQRITSILRKSDTIARMGGDEFIGICCMITAPEDAGVIARKIIATISEQFDLKRGRCSVSMSIGISIYPMDGDDAETLLNKADEAMYRIKKNGKGGYLFYSDTSW